jgi:hypothetical protein
MSPGDLINPVEAAFLGLSGLAAAGAAFGAVRALRYLKGSFAEANNLNKLTLQEMHRRVRPRIALRAETPRTTEPPIAFDAGLVISGADNIHEVDVGLDLGVGVPATSEPDYIDFLEPGLTQPLTFRWTPTPTPTVGRVLVTYLDSMGKRTQWSQSVLADDVGLRPTGKPETRDAPER